MNKIIPSFPPERTDDSDLIGRELILFDVPKNDEEIEKLKKFLRWKI